MITLNGLATHANLSIVTNYLTIGQDAQWPASTVSTNLKLKAHLAIGCIDRLVFVAQKQL